jgi:hypothetical protein
MTPLLHLEPLFLTSSVTRRLITWALVPKDPSSPAVSLRGRRTAFEHETRLLDNQLRRRSRKNT